MGIWGRVKANFSGRPKPPSEHSEYGGDAYWDQQGLQNTMGADRLSYGALQDLFSEPPGYRKEDIEAMYARPASAIRRGEERAVTSMNRSASGSGSFGSGGKTRGVGMARSEGSRARGDVGLSVQAMAAEKAWEDRYRRLAAAEAYVNPRLGYGQNESRMKMGYDLAGDQFDMQSYMSELNQYNADFQWNQDQAELAAKMVGSFMSGACWVARAIYGGGDSRWLLAREYIILIGPKWFCRLYLRYGERFAGWLENHRWAIPILRPLFDRFVKRAAAWRNGVLA